MTDLTEAQRAARREQAREAIERGLRESHQEWTRTRIVGKPTFDFPLAAAYVMDALGDQAAEILADGTMMRALTVKDGVVTLELEEATEILKVFVASMRGVLDGYGAENYVETEMSAPSVSMDVRHGPDPRDSYTVTIQRRTGTTPHEFRALAEQRAEQAEAELEEARMWARHGYEIGQRSCTWSDYGVAPAWLTETPPLGPPPIHIGDGANAEDCPACSGTNPPYPFICPGPTTKD